MSTFSKEQMTFLSQFEDRLSTAHKAQWCRAMGQRDFEAVYDLWKEVSGEVLERNANCASCVLELMSRVGAAYFAQQEAEARVQLSKAKTTAKRSVKMNGKK